MVSKRVTRRQTLVGVGAGLTAAAGLPIIGAAQTKVAPITVVINQSPWFDSFHKTVEVVGGSTRSNSSPSRARRSRSSASLCAPRMPPVRSSES